MTLERLLAFRDEEFIHAAYRGVLCRESDPGGLAYHLGELRRGALSKLDILVLLRFSEEGRRAGVRVPGLTRAYWTLRIKKLPVVGHLLQIGYGIWRLPTLLNNTAAREAYIDFQFSDVRQLQGQVQDLRRELVALRAATPSMIMLVELQHHLARLEFAKANRKEFAILDERVDIALSLKAGLEEVAALARQVATKAGQEEVTALRAATPSMTMLVELQHHLARLEFAKSNRKEFAILDERVDIALSLKAGLEEVAALAQQVGTKAEQEEVAALAQQVGTKAGQEEVAALAQQVGSRAGQEEVAALAQQIGTKAGQEEVAALAQQIGSRAGQEEVAALAQQIGTRAGQEEVAALAGQVRAVEASKADQHQLGEVESRITECESYRVDPNRVVRLGDDLQAVANQIAACRRDLQDQHHRLAVFLELARKRLPEAFTPEQLTNLLSEERHLLDSLYVAFEDRFRGSREAVLNGTKVYLPCIQKVMKKGNASRPLLDVACGRGEWLELLQASGYRATGVDVNRTALRQCKDFGLDVVEDDAIEYLRKQPNNAFSVVTCFHYVEHIDYQSLIALLDEALRVLTPGGMAIFETPNVRNILVASSDFYRDPTHKHPVFPDTLESLAELRGFAESTAYCFNDTRTELIPLSTYRFDDLNAYMSISRDVAWIGVKSR